MRLYRIFHIISYHKDIFRIFYPRTLPIKMSENETNALTEERDGHTDRKLIFNQLQ